MADDASGAVRRTPGPTEDTCRAYDVDGEPVRVHGGKPLDEAGQAALGEIVRAATAKLAAEHPNLGVTQELIMAGLAATRCIPDGEVRGGCTVQDGAKVKARLKAAIGAARDALGTERRPIVLLRAEDCACRYGDDCPHGPEPVDALDLAVWLHAEAQYFRAWTLKAAELELASHGRAEDKLQARIDAAVRWLDDPQALTPAGQLYQIRAALQGDQPTEEDR